jgi:AcrR family transcriptional regulator
MTPVQVGRAFFGVDLTPAKIRRREERRQVILDVATDLFSAKGYHGTSMRDLGDALGLYPGSLYAHIRSKEDVLYAIVDHVSELYEDQLRAVLESGLPPLDQLRELTRRHLCVGMEHLRAATVCAHEWKYLGARRRALIGARRDQYEAGLRSIVAACIADGTFRPLDVPLASIAILGVLNWTYVWYRPHGRLRPPELAHCLVEFLIDGFSPRPATRPAAATVVLPPTLAG